MPGRLQPWHGQRHRVVIWGCNGQTNQQWNVNADGTITNVNAGLCLDATGGGTANGTKLLLWTCNGGKPEVDPQLTGRPGRRMTGTADDRDGG